MNRASSARGIRTLAGLGLSSVIVVGLGGCSGSTGGDTASSCVAQEVTVSPTSAAPGDEVVVRGTYFTDGCGDAVEAGSAPTPAAPLTEVPVVITTAGGEDRLVATVDAEGSLGEITHTLDLPADLVAGQVSLRLGDAEPVTLTVTAP